MRQPRFGHGDAQASDLLGRHQDLRAVAAQLIGHIHRIELLDDLSAVAQIELAVEQPVAGRGKAAAQKDEEADGGGKDEPDGAQTRRPEVAQIG